MIIQSFKDAHLHFVGMGLNALEYIDLSQCKSHDEVVTLLQKETHRSMIIARGWHQENFLEKESITKDVLNKVSVTCPILAIRTCGHVVTINDAFIDLLDASTITNVSGGSIDVKTGIFTENALEIVYDKIPVPSIARIKEYMKEANDILLSYGITACGSDDFSTLPNPYTDIIQAYKEAYEEGLIQVRITQQVNIPDLSILQDFINKGHHTMTFGRFTMGPLKLLADGSLGGRTAALKEDYSDDPLNKGILTFEQDVLDDLIGLAHKNGMDVAIHAIGDHTIDQVIESIEKSLDEYPRDHNHSIIHNQLCNHQQIKKLKDLKIGAIVQPIFLNSDIPIIESRLGERSKETYLFHSMYKEITTAFSTDCPVEPVNPFYNLYCAITRTSIKTKTNAFLKEEAFTLKEALDAYTIRPMIYLGNNNDTIEIKGNIEQPMALLDSYVTKVWMDGQVVYHKKGE
jgi:predicted amidohydrolase YtcJ